MVNKFLFGLNKPPAIFVPDDTWTLRAVYTGLSNQYTFGAGLGSNIYFGGGSDQNSDWNMYDTIGDAWSAKMAMPVGRGDSAAFSLGGYIYICTGRRVSTNNPTHKDTWRYYPAGNTWTQMANIGTNNRYGGAATASLTKGYCGFGFQAGGVGYSNEFWEYNPGTNIWTQKLDIPGNGRYNGHMAFANNGKIYAGLGVDGAVINKDWYEYNIDTNTWTAKTPYPGTYLATTSRKGTCMAIGDKIFVGGGFTTEWYMYDTTLDTWTAMTVVPASTNAGYSMVANGKIYIHLGAATKTFYEYK